MDDSATSQQQCLLKKERNAVDGHFKELITRRIGEQTLYLVIPRTLALVQRFLEILKKNIDRQLPCRDDEHFEKFIFERVLSKSNKTQLTYDDMKHGFRELQKTSDWLKYNEIRQIKEDLASAVDSCDSLNILLGEIKQLRLDIYMPALEIRLPFVYAVIVKADELVNL